MERWAGRTVVVMNATDDVGFAICKELVKYGMSVLALYKDCTLGAKLMKETEGSLKAMRCDPSSEGSMLAVFDSIRKVNGCISVLINNCGYDEKYYLSMYAWTREAFRMMKANDVKDGIIIMINSYPCKTTASSLVVPIDSANENSLDLTLFSKRLRKKMGGQSGSTRLTNISYGAVLAESPTGKENAANSISNAHVKSMTVGHVVETILYVLNMPPRVNVDQIVIEPVSSKQNP